VNANATPYDRVPYPRAVHRETHPDHVAAVATLFGMDAPPPERCRVLELGCASGANLTAMAAVLPDSEFVGLELSPRQVADGRALVEELGLTNVRLEQGDLQGAGAELGLFDYVIAHGLYSWVPPAVRDRLLALCGLLLRPHGVAYVSYNAYPGCHARRMLGEMMRHHARGEAEPSRRVAAARALLSSLLEAPPPDMPDYAATLRELQDTVSAMPDVLVYHDLLAEVNEPIYLHEFVERAAGHGLQYLTDAATIFPQLPPALATSLGVTGAVETEQYADFVHGRAFRMSLLCRAGLPLDRSSPDRHLDRLHVSAPARFTPPGSDVGSDREEKFARPGLAGQAVAAPLVKAAFLCLQEAWPCSVPFADLPARARSRLGATPADAAAVAPSLAEAVLRGFAGGVLGLHVWNPPVVAAAGDRPLAGALARWEAARGEFVTSLRHEVVFLDAIVREVLRHCDGRHDRAALSDRLEEAVRAGNLVVRRQGRLVRGGAELRTVLSAEVDRGLTALARAAVLMTA
jgi:SAM-dependent methyltransferase